MKKILICSNVYPPDFIGGAELIAHYHAKALKKLGHDVVIFTGDIAPIGERYEMRKEIYEGLLVYRIRLVAEDYRSDYVNFSHPLVENHFSTIISQFQPNIVHFHNIIGLSLALPTMAKGSGAKTVITLHDHWGFCHRNTLINTRNEICKDYNDCKTCMPFIEDGDFKNIPIQLRKDYFNLCLQDIDFFITPSQYLADQYIESGFPKERFHVIWNGLQVERFMSITKKTSKKIRFSFIGYMGHHKGVNVILEAMLHLKNKERFQLNLVGEGEYKASYIQFVKEHRLNECVRFWGKVDNNRIEDVYSETDVLILPSIWPENQPVSITEAMSAAIPVIASRMGGIPELVEDEITGFLFDAGNDIQLASIIDKLISQQEMIFKLGKNAQLKMKQNTFYNQVNKIVDIYNDLIVEKETSEEFLIGISGNRVNDIFIKAIDLLSNLQLPKYKIIKSNWINYEQFKDLSLLIIVDKEGWFEPVLRGIQLGIPLLVNEENLELKELCIKENCGLFYSNPLEAALCTQYILTNDKLRDGLGKNAMNIWKMEN